MILLAIVGGSLAVTSPSPTTDISADATATVLTRTQGAASRSADRDLIATPITVKDGSHDPHKTLTATATVRDALLEQDVVLGQDDYVEPALDTPLSAGLEISIVRVTQDTVSENVITERTTRTEQDPTKLVGTQSVAQEGADGKATTVFTVLRDSEGVELSREVLMSAIVSEPVERVIVEGTKEVPVAKPALSAPAVPSAPASGPIEAGSNREIGARLVAERGWGADQFACLDSLWTKESGWNHLAANRSSGAYGIPQSLPGSKMASVGADWQTNPATQITWGLGYISGRYGSPCGAWEHSKVKNWY